MLRTALSANSLQSGKFTLATQHSSRSQLLQGSGFARRQSPRRAARQRTKQHFPSSKLGKQNRVCVPAAPARPSPAAFEPTAASPGLSPRSRRHTCPGAFPRRPAGGDDTLSGRAPTRPAAGPTHPAQPAGIKGVSAKPRRPRLSHRPNNSPAARGPPLPASASRPEVSLATILRRLRGDLALTGGDLGEDARAVGARRAPMGSTEGGT